MTKEQQEQMEILFLGTGTSSGVPRIGCDCAVCHSSDPANKRTRTSALIRFKGRNLLIDTSPDLRQQALRSNLRQVDAVLYTHEHADHSHGIDDLRVFSFLRDEGDPLVCYGAPPTLEALRQRFAYAFRVSSSRWSRIYPRLNTQAIEGPFELFGLPIVPLRLPHGRQEVLGYRIGDLAYCTDCKSLPEVCLPWLQDLELLVLGALRHRLHPGHMNLEEALDAASRLHPKKTLLTHLSHEIDYHAVSARLPENVELAHDGLCLSLPLPAKQAHKRQESPKDNPR
jgi:phosphoribosyl 1,2-cyclic phosphate phosphodiesterase